MHAATIGNFDGVHAGHRALVTSARAHVGPSGRVTALCFDPHPLERIRPERAPQRLSTFAQRERWLRDAGADDVIRLEPDPVLLNESPTQFVEWLVKQHKPDAVVEGQDFCFGKGRSGTIETLTSLGHAFGFSVVVVPPVEVTLTDHSIVRASSSLTRWLLAHGRVADAALVLGRPYTFTGTVVQGDRRGRTLGFPTANLHCDVTPPADGVYACRAKLPSGSTFAAAMNIGTRPTFAGFDRRVEVHLLDAPRTDERLASLPEYGWVLEVEVHAWIRDQVKFTGIDALTGQLQRDIARIRNTLAHPPQPPISSPVATAPSPLLCSRSTLA